MQVRVRGVAGRCPAPGTIGLVEFTETRGRRSVSWGTIARRGAGRYLKHGGKPPGRPPCPEVRTAILPHQNHIEGV